MSGLILSCEHASARVPEEFRGAFPTRDSRAVLDTHRGFDVGALPLARGLKRDVEGLTKKSVPLAAGSMTRLLIDLNRSPTHRSVMSDFSSKLSKEKRAHLRAYHQEYHDALRALIVREKGQVLHVAVHTFVPALHGKVRTTDVGILFDPARKPEATFAARCQEYLEEATGLRVHRNSPYRGVADGLPTLLRREFSARKYVGIELEINQNIVLATGRRLALRSIRAALVQVLLRAVLPE